MFFKIFLLSALLLAHATSPLSDRLIHDSQYREISANDGVRIELRYDTPNNFLHQAVYGEFNQCFLQRVAAEKILRVIEDLKIQKPGWKLLFFDCLRPHSVQKKMWEIVKGTSQQKYVGDPGPGSVHNFGLAVDLSLSDEKGKEVDMGTPFDFFGREAEPSLEEENLKLKKLTQVQIDHRMILRRAMEKQGFRQLPTEWWHYDALPPAQVRKEFKMIE